MKFSAKILFAFVALLCLSVSIAQETDFDEKDVKVLGDSNFTSVVSGSKHALVEFYAPWCGHCKRLAPNYAAAASSLAKDGVDVILAKVDATVETGLAAQFQVQGYPTIKWVIEGSAETASDYSGGRDTDEIVKWVKKKTGPTVQQVSSQDEVKAAFKDSEVVFLAYVSNYKSKDSEILDTVSKTIDDAVFLETTDASLAKKYGLKKASSLVAIQNFENEAEKVTQYEGRTNDKDTLEPFIQGKLIPAVVPLNQKYYGKIFGAKVTKQILIVASKDQIFGSSKSAKSLQTVATKYEGKVIVVGVDKEDSNMAQVLQFFGLEDPGKEIAVVGFNSEDSSKFVMKEKFSESNVNKFIQSFLDNKLEKTLKSAEEPKSLKDDDGVTVVVGKNYDKVVKDSSKDVLLEVYAPWCGHCKAMAPMYAELAKELSSEKSVVISKTDGTENEFPDFSIQGFPSLFFFPAGSDKKPISYGGDRSKADLIQFIQKNAQGPYKNTSGKAKDEL